MNTKDATVPAIEQLIKICQRSERAFRQAAAAAADEAVRRLLSGCAHQRRRFVKELSVQKRRGVNPWNTVASPDEATVVEFEIEDAGEADWAKLCLRGIEESDEAYREALERELPSNARFLVKAQYSLLKEAHERVRAAAELKWEGDGRKVAVAGGAGYG